MVNKRAHIKMLLLTFKKNLALLIQEGGDRLYPQRVIRGGLKICYMFFGLQVEAHKRLIRGMIRGGTTNSSFHFP